MPSISSAALAASPSDLSEQECTRQHSARRSHTAAPVLSSQWPGIPCYDDVRTLNASRLRRDGISINAIAGGMRALNAVHNEAAA